MRRQFVDGGGRITGYTQSLLFSHFFVPSPRAILGTKEILSVGGRRKLWNIYTTPTISSLPGYCQLTAAYRLRHLTDVSVTSIDFVSPIVSGTNISSSI